MLSPACQCYTARHRISLRPQDYSYFKKFLVKNLPSEQNENLCRVCRTFSLACLQNIFPGGRYWSKYVDFHFFFFIFISLFMFHLKYMLSRPTYSIVILLWRKFICDKPASGMLTNLRIVFTFTRQRWSSATFSSDLA